MLAETLAIGWATCYVVASRTMPKVFGSQSVGGTVRWRTAWAIPTQFVVLPLLYTYRGEALSLCFTYLFALYMLLDFVLVKLTPIMYAHHAACLTGHLLTCLLLPGGFVTYFAGVVALEFGSGCMNFWLLDYGSNWRTRLYVVGMTLSNAAAVLAGVQWAALDLPLELPWQCPRTAA